MNSTHTRPSLRLLIAATAVLALLGLLIAGFLESSKDETTGLAAPKTARDDVSAKRSTGTPESGSSIAVAPEPNPPTDDFAPGERERRVERSASITLAAPEDNLDEAARGVARVAERRRGFITSSTLSTGEDGANGGTFELRVPSRELSAALADLGDLGSVR
ncbi:MAG: DUF4349 domain-containing protein, partial [Thermoleophilaceae bacterium]|nr:DUF4349 domain-containing protein [Thermoleophilaceae bacterium]